MNESEVKRILSVFADLATPFSVTPKDGRLEVAMFREGESRTYVIDDAGAIAAKPSGKRYLNLASLLASEEFVNVREFKATQRRILKDRTPACFIPPEGELSLHGQAAAVNLEFDDFKNIIGRQSDGHLSIMLLDGPAGIGKTSLIERIAYERAEPASTAPPILHVVSSGGRLTDLNKALAHATQSLRLQFTFDQVPVLTRLGVIQVAIDGFDELVDPDGYKDAWSALRNFLLEVGSCAPMILSGRDTFFDQQSFEERLASKIKNLSLDHARLRPVSPGSAKTYLKQSGWSDNELKEVESSGWLVQGSYHLRPFFLAQIGGTGGWDSLSKSHSSPQLFLVKQFVLREAGKVNQMVEIDGAEAERSLWQFYGLVVDDMASNETDSVDIGFLSVACETAFEPVLNPNDLAKLTAKAGSFGLLESGGSGNVRRFPHSELQNQFLARSLFDELRTADYASNFMRRGRVDIPLIQAFIDQVEEADVESVATVKGRLDHIISREGYAERLVSNCGGLLISLISRSDLPSVSVGGFSVYDAKIVGVACESKFAGTHISHLDVRAADCKSLDLRNADIVMLTVDASTKFGGFSPGNVRILQVESNGSVVPFRDPADIAEWIGAHSDAMEEGAASELPLVRYFDRLCRRFMRQHQIRVSSDDSAYFLIQDPLWEEIKLIAAERIVTGTKDSQGPNNQFIRMSRPEALLSPGKGDVESAAIRAEVVRRAKQLGARQ